jgi:hypothetical protein
MGDWGRNGEDHQKEVASQMNTVAAKASVDFIVSAGDNFYPRGVRSEYDPLWHFSFENIYTGFALQWDWYPVLGNHDYGDNPEAQVRYSAISRRWNMPSRYYKKSIRISGDTTNQLLLIFIDTTPLINRYYRGPGHKVHDQDSVAQRHWIESTLADREPNVKWTFVVGHHPMYTGGGRENSDDTRAIRRVLEPLLTKYKVDAYLGGHEHSLQHLDPGNGVQHFVSGAASENTPVKKIPGTKFAASQYGFMLFSVSREKALVQIIDFEGKVLYTTSLTK